MVDEIDICRIVETGSRWQQPALGKQFFRVFETRLAQQHLLGFFIHAEIARALLVSWRTSFGISAFIRT